VPPLITVLDHIIFGDFHRLFAVAARRQARKGHRGLGEVVHQEETAIIARQEKPFTTRFVEVHAVWQLEGLAVWEAGGAAVRKQKPRHRRRWGKAALARRRAPRAANGRKEGPVGACAEAEEHQAEELRREVLPWRCP
jgi:hypothetical protein